jgi:hypothetical protein
MCERARRPQYDVPLLPPRLAVARADPEVVLCRRVRAEEEPAERERQREEKEMRELRHRNMRTRTATAMAPDGIRDHAIHARDQARSARAAL